MTYLAGRDAKGNTVERWEIALLSAGCRITAPRLLILEAIARRARQFTAEALADELRPYGVGRATVFRTIDLLTELGILHRLHGEGCHAYTACVPGHHHHLVCSQCGRVVNVETCGLEEQMRKLAHETNFAIDQHYLEFSGRCPACRGQ
jgi:Fur family ferric uptake transcriptional regulator